jgi:hypothetical protein
MPLAKKKKNLITFVVNILLLLFLLFFITTNIYSHIGTYYFLQLAGKIISPKKEYVFGSTRIFIPAGTVGSDSIEIDNIVMTGGVNFEGNWFNISYFKNEDRDFMERDLANTLDENVNGDILGLPYLFKYNADEIYILVTIKESFSAEDYFRINTRITIPVKKIIFDVGSMDFSMEKTLNLLKRTVYKNQRGEFIFDDEGTNNLRPWKK